MIHSEKVNKKEAHSTMYKGTEEYTNDKTGEKIVVDKVYRKQVQGNFVKAYIKGLVQLLDVTGGAKLKVVNYLIENLSLSDNILLATVREIAEAIGSSPTTVTKTLKTLEEGHIISRRTGAIMFNPSILYRGDDQKHRYLLVEFKRFDRVDELSHAQAEFESFGTHDDYHELLTESESANLRNQLSEEQLDNYVRDKQDTEYSDEEKIQFIEDNQELDERNNSNNYSRFQEDLKEDIEVLEDR